MSDAPLIGRIMGEAEAPSQAEFYGRPAMHPAVRRAASRAVAHQYARGLVGVARVRTVDMVATESLVALDDLERLEAAAVARDPMNAGHRQRAIVDAAASTFRQAVIDTGSAP